MLEKVVHCSQNAFEQIASGSHPTETYSNDHLYTVELPEELQVGITNSGLTVNESNQLVVSLLSQHIPNLPTSKITSGTFDAARIPSLDASKITSGVFAAARIAGITYTTTAPTAANTDGVKIAILSSAPATKYDGWLYFIAGA